MSEDELSLENNPFHDLLTKFDKEEWYYDEVRYSNVCRTIS